MYHATSATWRTLFQWPRTANCHEKRQRKKQWNNILVQQRPFAALSAEIQLSCLWVASAVSIQCNGQTNVHRTSVDAGVSLAGIRSAQKDEAWRDFSMRGALTTFQPGRLRLNYPAMVHSITQSVSTHRLMLPLFYLCWSAQSATIWFLWTLICSRREASAPDHVCIRDNQLMVLPSLSPTGARRAVATQRIACSMRMVWECDPIATTTEGSRIWSLLRGSPLVGDSPLWEKVLCGKSKCVADPCQFGC